MTSTKEHDPSPIGVTLETFILEGMLQAPEATGAFTSLLNQIVLAAKLVSSRVRRAGLANVLGYTGDTNVQGERVQKLDVIANETMIRTLERQGYCLGLASEELDDPVVFDRPKDATGYLVVTDPLDGSSNIDVDISIGTIFGILRHPGGTPTKESFLCRGREYCAAGYVIYGSSTVLVMTTGNGVHGFTYDPTCGEFFLSHSNVICPPKGDTYSINEGNYERWNEGTKAWSRWIKEKDPASGRPYTHRYVGSLVADAHRTLLRGGIFAYPSDRKNPDGKLRLLYEANPIAMVFEAAQGSATDGRGAILDLVPTGLHMRTPLVVGSNEDVETFVRMARS